MTGYDIINKGVYLPYGYSTVFRVLRRKIQWKIKRVPSVNTRWIFYIF